MNRRLILAGASGFLGAVLTRHFLAERDAVVILTRQAATPNGAVKKVRWDGCTLGDWVHELENASGVINLAGRSVNCRYTERNRREILDSRTVSTRVLGEAIARCRKPPPVWLNASTATIYRHTFAEVWDESGEIAGTPEAKDEFSVSVARAWERDFFSAKTPGTRRVALRSGMVLGNGANSVFPTLRRLVRLGLGGRMGTGKQFISWIHELDFARAVAWLLANEAFNGVVNVTAPNPITNSEMMSLLRTVCRMPLGLPAPRWLLEIGAFCLRTETELIIKSRRVAPARLLASGFAFRFPTALEALEDLNRARA